VDIGYYFFLIAFLLPLVFIFLLFSKRAEHQRITWFDVVFSLLSFVIPFYFFLNSLNIYLEGWDVSAPIHAQIISLVLILLVFEGVRRAAGLIFMIIAIFFAAFPLFSSYTPVPFKGVQFDFWRSVSFVTMGSEGFLGIPMQVVGNLVLGFMIFAVALIATGGGDFFIKIAMALLGFVRGGPAKISVVASALFGSISGSVVANILVDGGVTIPTMKRAGYPAHYAAAVEACASTGGVLMPPVMGTAAFIIAQFLAIPYVEVAIAAAIPSILYYLGLFMQADAYAANHNIKGLPRESLPSIKQTLKEGWFYIVAFLILLVLLLYMRKEAQAPYYATAALILLSCIKKETRFSIKRLWTFLENSGETLSDLMITMLGIGFIIGSLSMTGVAHSFSSEVIGLSGGNIALLLFFGALTSFILGMGMSVTACYIFLAVLLAPALIRAGLYPLGVHLYVLYWGMISYITPPVAVGAITAASIIGADPFRTGYTAMRLGIVIYFVPVFFVLNPALLLHGDPLTIVVSIITAIIGVMLIAAGVEGYLLSIGRVNPITRAILIVAGLLLAYPTWQPTVAGLVIAITLLLILKLRKRRQLEKSEIS